METLFIVLYILGVLLVSFFFITLFYYDPKDSNFRGLRYFHSLSIVVYVILLFVLAEVIK